MNLTAQPEKKMEIKRDTVDSVPLLRLDGRLSFRTASALRDTLRAYVDRGEPVLLVDLRNLELIDTSGVATLLESHREMRDDNGPGIVLIGDTPAVQQALSLAGLEDDLETCQDEQEALAYLQERDSLPEDSPD
jgi:anti-anti-sigma factor